MALLTFEGTLCCAFAGAVLRVLFVEAAPADAAKKLLMLPFLSLLCLLLGLLLLLLALPWPTRAMGGPHADRGFFTKEEPLPLPAMGSGEWKKTERKSTDGEKKH